MQVPAIGHKPTQTPLSPTLHFSVTLVLSFLLLTALWFGLCQQLSGEWSVNQQYNFGWFVPFFAFYLFWLRWQDRPPPDVRGQKSEVRGWTFIASAIAMVSLFLLLPVRLFEIANPEWRPLAWIHAASVVTLTLLYLWCVGGSRWLRHFAFPVAFIFVAVPWPTPLEAPIIQGLMRTVAHVAAETAMLLGIPAQVEGNLIRVSTGLVGVNEACSGIRSLQTSLMIGLLFGELKRLSVLRRVALVAGSMIDRALRAIFFAQFFWSRSQQRKIFSSDPVARCCRLHDCRSCFPQHDGTGLSARAEKARTPCVERRVAWRKQPQLVRLPLPFAAFYLGVALCWLLFVEIGTSAWYRAHERNLVSGIRWTVRWPEQAPKFRRLNIDPEIRSVLRFDEGESAAWMLTPSPTFDSSPPVKTSGTQVNRLPPNVVACYLYVFRWNPGRNSALLANLHRPDVCLPASGWTQMADDGVRNYLVTGTFELPFRHFEFQRAFGNSAPQTAHAFYCLSEDRAAESSAPAPTSLPSMTGNPSEWTRSERLRTVLEGRRHLGQQVIEAIFVSDESISSADAESRLRDLTREVVFVQGRGD